MKYGSLFSGIGGIDLGLDRAGMECTWQVEINDYAQRVLAKHWPHVQRFRDVTECGSHNLAKVDLIAAGFPCQDISYAGRGAGIEAERSSLFFEALRVVRELQPRYVLLENVAALLTRGLDRVLGELGQIGYDAEWHCIPAAAVGAPHIRDRVFIIAYADSRFGKKQELTVFSGGDAVESSRELYDSNADSRRLQISEERDSEPLKRFNETSQWNHADGLCHDLADADSELFNGVGGGTKQTGRRQLTNSSWWTVEPDVGRVADGIPKRVDRLRCLGNAVVPQVAEWIGRQIMKCRNEQPA